MTDIFDINPNSLPALFDLKYTFAYIVFCICAWWVYQYILKQKKVPDIEVETISYTKKEINFFELIESVKTHHMQSEKEVFYTKLKQILVLFLEYKTWEAIAQMTLLELEKKNFSSDLKNLFKEIYFRQYSAIIKNDTSEYRKELLYRLKNELN